MSGSLGGTFKRLDPYEGMIRVLLKEGAGGCEAEALRYAGMVKSRLFLEQLAVREAVGSSPQDSAVLEQDRRLQLGLVALRARITRLQELGTRAPAGQLQQVAREFVKAEAEYEEFLNSVRAGGLGSINPDKYRRFGDMQKMHNRMK